MTNTIEYESEYDRKTMKYFSHVNSMQVLCCSFLNNLFYKFFFGIRFPILTIHIFCLFEFELVFVVKLARNKHVE